MAFPSYPGRHLDVGGRRGSIFARLSEAGIEGADRIGSYAIIHADDGEGPPFRSIDSDGSLISESRILLLAWAPYRLAGGSDDGAYVRLPLYRQGEPPCPGSGASWAWDGDEARPTLDPSIGLGDYQSGLGWHGWLRGGQWQGC